MSYNVPRKLQRPFKCPFGGANRGAVGASRGAAARSNSSIIDDPTTSVSRQSNSFNGANASSNESDSSHENESPNENVASLVLASIANETNSPSRVIARKPSPGSKRKDDGKGNAAPSRKTKAVKRTAPTPPRELPKSVRAERAAPTPAEPKNSSSSSLAASPLDQKMPSADTAFADTSSAQLQSLSKDSYFVDLLCTVGPEAFVECARALSGGEAKKLVELIVASARFHMDRCNNQMNLSELLKMYHDALSGAFVELSSASNLRSSYNNNASSATIPTHPPLPLPPGVTPVNVHQHGAVGQHCGRGAGQCVAHKSGTAPAFVLTSVSLGGGSGTVNQQYCATCNDCYAAIGFDPTKTFAGKAAFDSYMTTYATKHSFKLTKETGAKVSVGTAKVPKYVAVHCSKKSAHRRGSECTCPFKVSAVLREKGNGTYEYKLNKIELAHS